MPVWKFIVHTTDQTVGYHYEEHAAPDGSASFEGAPAEAVRAAGIIAARTIPCNWVAAVSEGPADVPDEAGWMAFRVVERADGKGWNLGSDGGGIRYRERQAAISHAVFQARDHVACIRVIARDGSLRRLLLIDQRDAVTDGLTKPF